MSCGCRLVTVNRLPPPADESGRRPAAGWLELVGAEVVNGGTTMLVTLPAFGAGLVEPNSSAKPLPKRVAP
jgi:hypothetical protein